LRIGGEREPDLRTGRKKAERKKKKGLGTGPELRSFRGGVGILKNTRQERGTPLRQEFINVKGNGTGGKSKAGEKQLKPKV